MALGNIIWLCIGFAGQGCFTIRFLFQWLYSERHRKSVIPAVFWHFSLLGSVILFTYALHNRDPVISFGQLFGIIIYIRNLHLLNRERKKFAIPAKKWNYLIISFVKFLMR